MKSNDRCPRFTLSLDAPTIRDYPTPAGCSTCQSGFKQLTATNRAHVWSIGRSRITDPQVAPPVDKSKDKYSDCILDNRRVLGSHACLIPGCSHQLTRTDWQSTTKDQGDTLTLISTQTISGKSITYQYLKRLLNWFPHKPSQGFGGVAYRRAIPSKNITSQYLKDCWKYSILSHVIKIMYTPGANRESDDVEKYPFQ